MKTEPVKPTKTKWWETVALWFIPGRSIHEDGYLITLKEFAGRTYITSVKEAR